MSRNVIDTSDVREFNVVFVTIQKRELGKRNAGQWHLPITGTAEIINSSQEVHGVKTQTETQIRVDLSNGVRGSGKLEGIREGLGGSCVLLQFNETGRHDGELFELYTDTPTEGHTAEEVRRNAADKIENNINPK